MQTERQQQIEWLKKKENEYRQTRQKLEEQERKESAVKYLQEHKEK